MLGLTNSDKVKVNTSCALEENGHVISDHASVFFGSINQYCRRMFMNVCEFDASGWFKMVYHRQKNSCKPCVLDNSIINDWSIEDCYSNPMQHPPPHCQPRVHKRYIQFKRKVTMYDSNTQIRGLCLHPTRISTTAVRTAVVKIFPFRVYVTVSSTATFSCTIRQ